MQCSTTGVWGTAAVESIVLLAIDTHIECSIQLRGVGIPGIWVMPTHPGNALEVEILRCRPRGTCIHNNCCRNTHISSSNSPSERIWWYSTALITWILRTTSRFTTWTSRIIVMRSRSRTHRPSWSRI